MWVRISSARLRWWRRVAATSWATEVNEAPRSDFPAELAYLEHLILEKESLVEIRTDDVNTTIGHLTRLDVPLNHLRIRPRNLEDLCLDLTGKALRT